MADYCGCCGNEIIGRRRKGDGDPLWCAHCRAHVSDHGPLWERTWFAQRGEPCPRQT
jgi:hypothetical protein